MHRVGVLHLLECPVTTAVTVEQEERVKPREETMNMETMNMLEAFGLAGCCGMLASWPVGRITPSPCMWPSATRAGWLPGQVPMRQ